MNIEKNIWKLLEIIANEENSTHSNATIKFSNLPISPHHDYRGFLVKFPSGCEGPIGDSNCIFLWGIDILRDYNDMYEVKEFAEDLFLIGSDGGNKASGINIKNNHYVEVPFIGMSLDEAKHIATNFCGFINYLKF